jgi:hypothetical protein
MTTQLKLLTSQEAFHTLHQAINSKKATIKISNQMLTNLLVDYSVMLAALSKVSGFVVTEPKARPRLRVVEEE